MGLFGTLVSILNVTKTSISFKLLKTVLGFFCNSLNYIISIIALELEYEKIYISHLEVSLRFSLVACRKINFNRISWSTSAKNLMAEEWYV